MSTPTNHTDVVSHTPPDILRPMAWNPWRALREREHITFARCGLPDGIDGMLHRQNGRSVVLLDVGLNQAERNAVLAHELVHDERGGGADHPDAPDTWRAVAVREERTVDRITLARLVPADELAAWLATHDGPVEAWQLAEAFGIPEQWARLLWGEEAA